MTVLALHAYLLQRGGACLLHELYEHFSNSPQLPLEVSSRERCMVQFHIFQARESIGEGKRAFLAFLTTHTWILSVFPSKVFVGVRRQLPGFDYANFIEQHFPGHDIRQGAGSPRASTHKPPAMIKRSQSEFPAPKDIGECV